MGGEEDGLSSSSTTFDPGAPEFVPVCRPPPIIKITQDPESARPSRLSNLAGLSAAASARKNMREPTSLLSPTWSPSTEEYPRSAGVPQKSSWESFPPEQTSPALTPQRSPTALTAVNSTISTPLTSSPLTRSPLSSSNAMSSGVSFARDQDGRVSGAHISLEMSNHPFTRTAEYHNSPASATFQKPFNSTAQSDPLPQRPFYRQNTESSSGGSISSRNHNMPDTPQSTMSSFASRTDGDQNSSADQESVASSSIVSSEQYTVASSEQALTKGPVWAERTAQRSLRRALRDPNAQWEEAYPGALSVLTALNPEHYQMPYGAHVVNIKTEFPMNMLSSVRCGRVSFMAKVAQRIMQLWDARVTQDEKIIFLFSINGGKRFAGLAEMSGPWDEDDYIDGWAESRDAAAPCVGSIPITWKYVKDVGFHHFSHIRQAHNGHPVGNMWNGMNFPSDTGRLVIEKYVGTPATSSILGYPRNWKENEHLTTVGFDGANDHRHPSGQRRGTPSTRGGRGGRGRQRVDSQNWRHDYEPDQSKTYFEDETTPLAGSPQIASQTARMPAPVYGGGAAHLEPGQLLSVAVNEQGQLILVPAIDGTQSGNDGSISSAGSGADQCSVGALMLAPPEAAVPTGALHSTRSMHSLHEHAPSTSTARPPAGRSISNGQRNLLQRRSDKQRMRMESQHSETGGILGENFRGGAPEEETPTRRPHTYAARGALSIVPNLMSIDTTDNINLQLAKLHTMVAEQHTLLSELQHANNDDLSIRILKAKIARISAEKEEVEQNLLVLKSGTPNRRDSVAPDESLAVVPSNDDEPSPAQVQGVSLYGSGNGMGQTPSNKEASVFDKAPGGSGRSKGHGKGHKESWDLQTRKSIADLVSSPEKTPVQPSSAASSFFGGHAVTPDERKTFSFPTPSRPGAGVGGTSTLDTPYSSGFPPPGEKTPSTAGHTSQKSVSFHGPYGPNLR